MNIYLFFFISFFKTNFSSIIDCFKVFSFSRLIKFVPSRKLVYRIFNFEMSSFVIEIAIDVIRAELLAMGMTILGLTNDRVELTIVELHPNKVSEMKKILSKVSYFFLS